MRRPAHRPSLIVAAAAATGSALFVASPAIAGADRIRAEGELTRYTNAVPADARARVDAVYTAAGDSIVTLHVWGMAPNTPYGAHAHVKECGATGSAAGPHFQNILDPVTPSVDPAYANPTNEIWLDLTTDAEGNGVAQTRVPWQFSPSRRAKSVIIHVEHTHGPNRLRCRRGPAGLPDRGLLTAPGRDMDHPAHDDPRTDGELLAAVADGSTTALETLYRRHAAWLTVRLSRRCADSSVVDEVLQDTFVATWKGANRYSGKGEVAAWLWGIAIRRLVDALRRRPPLAESLDLYGAELGALESAEDRVLLGVEHGDLAGALSRLSPELRAVVQATVLDGLTTREAGRLLGLPAGTVKTRMMRARRELRKELA